MPDTIIQAIRETRDEYARAFNYDLHEMCLDLRREQESSGAVIIDLSTKRSQSGIAPHTLAAETDRVEPPTYINQPKT